MTDEIESPPSPQWAGVKRDREQVAFICDMPEADLERFLVLSQGAETNANYFLHAFQRQVINWKEIKITENLRSFNTG